MPIWRSQKPPKQGDDVSVFSHHTIAVSSLLCGNGNSLGCFLERLQRHDKANTIGSVREYDVLSINPVELTA